MGSLLSAVIANMVMMDLESSVVSNIENMFFISSLYDNVEKCIQYQPRVKFTIKEENKRTEIYLDLTLIRIQNGD